MHKEVVYGRCKMGLVAWQWVHFGQFVGSVRWSLREMQVVLSRPIQLQGWPCRKRLQHKQNDAHLLTAPKKGSTKEQ